MAHVSEQAYEEVLAGIAARAAQTNRQRIARLTEAVQLLGRGELDEAGRQQAVRVAHQLAGSAGTFGDVRAGELSRELEQLLTAVPSPAEVPVEVGERAARVVASLRTETGLG